MTDKLAWVYATLEKVNDEVHILMRAEKGDISAYSELLNSLEHCMLVLECIQES